MHGTTMVFLVAMPMAVAFFNYIVPLQIGARDVAFPRLNAFSYWIYLFGALFINFRLADRRRRPQHYLGGVLPHHVGPGTIPRAANVDFWLIGLSILGIASIRGRCELHHHDHQPPRAPGMRLMRMPLFTWMTFVTSFRSRDGHARDCGRPDPPGVRPVLRRQLLRCGRRGRRP